MECINNDTLQPKGERVMWIDIAKAICIIAMVMGHATSPFVGYIYLFHMPAFFILSGYTYRGERYTWWEFFKKKFISLIIPVFIINIIYIGFYKVAVVFDFYSYLNGADYYGLKQGLITFFKYLGTVDFGGATWFVVVLFFAEILFKTIQRCFKMERYDWVLGCLVGLTGWSIMSKGVTMPYMLDLGIYACLFFSLGVVGNRKKVLENNLVPGLAIPLAVVTAIYFGKVYFAGKLPMNWPTRTFEHPLIQLCSVLACVYLCCVVARLIERLPKIAAVFCYIGTHTYAILVLHFSVFRGITAILVFCKVFPLESLREFPTPVAAYNVWLPYTVVTLALCCLVAWLAGKNRWTNYLINAIPPRLDRKKWTAAFEGFAPRRRYLGYFLLLCILYAAILTIVFPGYFDPLFPHHSDILDYPYDATGYNIVTLFTQGSRPVGLALTQFFGLFGAYKGVMVSGVLATLLSMLLAVYSAEKEMERKPWLGSIIAYAFLVISSTSFYLSYTFDIYNTYALFFTTLTIALWYWSYVGKRNVVPYILLAILGLCNFLSKETYIVGLCVFFFAKIFLEKGKMRKKAIIFFCITTTTACVALLQARLAKSVFAGMGAYEPTHPYYTSLTPDSLFRTAKFYVQGFSNPWVVGLLILCLVLWLYQKRGKGLGMVALAAVGVMAYIPYLVLPNRTIPHSFFIAYVLAFTFILVVDIHEFKIMNAEVPRDMIQVGLCAVLVIFLLGSVQYSGTSTGQNSYATASGWLACEQPAKLTLNTADELNDALQPGDQVLVLGLEEWIETGYRGFYAHTIFRSDVHFFVATNYEAYAGPIAPNITYIFSQAFGDSGQYNVIVTYGVDSISIARQ